MFSMSVSVNRTKHLSQKINIILNEQIKFKTINLFHCFWRNNNFFLWIILCKNSLIKTKFYSFNVSFLWTVNRWKQIILCFYYNRLAKNSDERMRTVNLNGLIGYDEESTRIEKLVEGDQTFEDDDEHMINVLKLYNENESRKYF